MKKIKLTPADPYTEKWTDLDFAKQYEPDAWERTKWEKLWETEEYKEEKGEPYFELAGDEYRLFEQWRDIVAAAETNPALQDALERAIMVYHLTRIK